MNSIGEIGVLLPEIVDPLDYDLLRGIHTEAAALGYDVLVYCSIYNSQAELQQDAYTHGLENIFTLLMQHRLDGVITGQTVLPSAMKQEICFLGTLNAVFMGNNSLMEATFFAKTVPADTGLLGSAMSSAIAPAKALAFMFATTFNIPCLMALSMTYKESHSLKWTFKVALFYFCNALVLSCIVYHIADLFM